MDKIDRILGKGIGNETFDSDRGLAEVRRRVHRRRRASRVGAALTALGIAAAGSWLVLTGFLGGSQSSPSGPSPAELRAYVDDVNALTASIVDELKTNPDEARVSELRKDLHTLFVLLCEVTEGEAADGCGASRVIPNPLPDLEALLANN